MTAASRFMDDLTPAQQVAVEHRDGPLLILAGPGSGKTRVVTRRIANLLDHGVPERHILAITFTNKAAGEMAARVQLLAPGSKVWISTFHRFCSKQLRIHAELAGLKSNFTILDTADQKQAMRIVLERMGLSDPRLSPDKLLWRISAAKNDLISPEQYEDRFQNYAGGFEEGITRKVYAAWQSFLLESNAVDFDDLLVHVARLLDENEELRRRLADRYRYVLVDEYQDTNLAQYRIVAALSQRSRNLCVTGDPDQSIYGWRGARIENILRFEHDFPETQVIRLEQNFRSTAPILAAADSLIVNNSRRKHKELLTDKLGGEPVQLLKFDNSTTEAHGIAAKVLELSRNSGVTWNDVAVFYRVNSMSRELESAFSGQRIPFQVAAGVAFFDRAEIKDLLAYLRLLENPDDRTAFSRIINKPLRGLGKTSQQKLLAWAEGRKISPWSACARAAEVPGLSKKAVSAFHSFGKMLDEFTELNHQRIAPLLQRIDSRTRYSEQWRGSETEEARERLANVAELITAASQYDEQAGEEGSLQGFLEQTALVSDTDRLDNSAGRVTLMTLHAAKGLEFPVVFILGLEQGLLPHERAVKSEDSRQIEEERRLLFVGLTRAKERLFLTQARERTIRGRTTASIISQFQREIHPQEVDCTNPQLAWSLIMSGGKQTLPQSIRDEFGDEFAQPEADEGSHYISGASGRTSLRTETDDADDPDVVSSAASPPARRVSSTVAGPLLMTGSALLAGNRQAAPVPLGFTAGQQVRHPRYGRGVVLSTSGVGARRSVDVRFEEGDRTETFIVSKAPLQPLG